MPHVSRLWAALPLVVALAGCDVPTAPIGASVPPPPTLQGQINGQAGGKLRIALLGAPQAGQAIRELVSVAASDNSYSLRLPPAPPLDLMLANETQSIAFTLTAYRDADGNGAFEPGEETNAVADTSVFRFFSSDGPAGSYKAGWNALKNGQWTQGFNTAFNLSTDTTASNNP